MIQICLTWGSKMRSVIMLVVLVVANAAICNAQCGGRWYTHNHGCNIGSCEPNWQYQYQHVMRPGTPPIYTGPARPPGDLSDHEILMSIAKKLQRMQERLDALEKPVYPTQLPTRPQPRPPVDTTQPPVIEEIPPESSSPDVPAQLPSATSQSRVRKSK